MRRSVNSVYKETEDTHTHTSYTHQCYDEDADEDYYEDIKNNRICFSP